MTARAATRAERSSPWVAQHLALDRGRRLIMIFFGRGKISEMMGDMAKGIKAFKKGMAEDDTAAATTPAPSHPVTTETVRTIEHRISTRLPPPLRPSRAARWRTASSAKRP
jgi:sec-independent protein translocase protein TatA